MTRVNPLKAVEQASIPTETSQSVGRPYQRPSGMKAVFLGPNGLRVGWRLLIFAMLIIVLLAGSLLIRSGGIQGIREAQSREGQITLTPALIASSEVVAFVLICLATFIMSRIERRRFSAYGLPLQLALRNDFWVGVLCGFLAISGTLLSMFLLHGFRITGLALHGTAIFSAPAAWGIAFLLAGLTEEFLCRGYLQYTLASGIGFWPSAFVMSCVFAFGHAFNPHETSAGVASVVLFGLLLCLFLRRSGNLWCAVGFHAAYDWGQTFFGVPDSGIAPYHNLFNSTFSGPRWLTGGIVGPEASVLTPIALALVALVFTRYYRKNRYLM